MRPVYGIANRGAFRMGFPNLPAPGNFDFNVPDLTLQPGALDAVNFSPPAAPSGAAPEAAPAPGPQGQVPLRPQYVLPTTEEGTSPEAAPEEKEEAPVESGGPTTVGWLAIGAGAAIGIGLIVAAIA